MSENDGVPIQQVIHNLRCDMLKKDVKHFVIPAGMLKVMLEYVDELENECNVDYVRDGFVSQKEWDDYEDLLFEEIGVPVIDK